MERRNRYAFVVCACVRARVRVRKREYVCEHASVRFLESKIKRRRAGREGTKRKSPSCILTCQYFDQGPFPLVLQTLTHMLLRVGILRFDFDS